MHFYIAIPAFVVGLILGLAVNAVQDYFEDIRELNRINRRPR